ncbi:MAG: cytochrome c [Bdellovibrionales bacterium]|nr:cytochrome c [Bdellovibrionales bacterium]
MNRSLLRAVGFLSVFVFGQYGYASVDWSEGAFVPPGGRTNIYNLNEDDLAESTRKGRLHALHYPVEVSGILLPFHTVEGFFDSNGGAPFKRFLKAVFKSWQGYESFDEVQEWMGLNSYPEVETGDVPFLNGHRPQYRMGLTKLQTHHGPALTVSCAQCHSANLFGKRVIGLTNRFTRANEFFIKGKRAMALGDPDRFAWITGASEDDLALYKHSYHSMKFVGLKKPIARGLDTSLAQVSLSLARRTKDAYASRDLYWAENPRHERLATEPADSKPATWWTLKYKNRWLSDGSLVSGNPIFTNFLWNEIGRGTDLETLEDWLEVNMDVVEELTGAVFATKAPSYFEFFSVEDFDLDAAKRGEAHFNKTCSRCHGKYVKAWSQTGAEDLIKQDLMKTVLVIPASQTRVYNVGTDPKRHEGMSSLIQLNDLEISKKYGIKIKQQVGYVAPPLNGIWARWPYFHNNSAPTLCDVLLPSNLRAKRYYLRASVDKNSDFDSTCNGYPSVSRRNWRRLPHENKVYLGGLGLSNTGHDEGIFVKDGQNLLNDQTRYELIRYLQTL